MSMQKNVVRRNFVMNDLISSLVTFAFCLLIPLMIRHLDSEFFCIIFLASSSSN